MPVCPFFSVLAIASTCVAACSEEVAHEPGAAESELRGAHGAGGSDGALAARTI